MGKIMLANIFFMYSVGYYGAGVIPTYCHAGGGNSLACGQVVTPVNITIDSLPDAE